MYFEILLDYRVIMVKVNQGKTGKVFEIQIESHRAVGQSIVGNMNLLRGHPPASSTSWQGRTKPAFTNFCVQKILTFN